MHLYGRISCVLACICSVGVAACGGDPGESTSTSASAGVTEGSSTGTGTTVTDGSAGSTSASTTAGDSDVSTTGGEDTVTGGGPTTGDDTAGSGASTGGDSTATGDDTTTTGVDSTSGDDSTSTGDVVPWDCEGEPITVNGQGKYSTLAAAIDAAPPGATITVCPGTYQEGVVITRPLTLLGAGKDKTFLDGGDVTTPIFIEAVDVTIEGFTFQHGKAIHPVGGPAYLCGGGLSFRYDSDFEMTVTVKDCDFIDNHGRYGGAICADGGDKKVSKLILENVTITGNSAEFRGGGIESYAVTTITDTTIVGNSADNEGGGIFFSHSDLTIVGGTVKQNTAEDGGGLYMQHPSTADVTASDWGFGQDQENLPNDVAFYVGEYGFFGANASFHCDVPEFDKGMCALK